MLSVCITPVVSAAPSPVLWYGSEGAIESHYYRGVRSTLLPGEMGGQWGRGRRARPGGGQLSELLHFFPRSYHSPVRVSVPSCTEPHIHLSPPASAHRSLVPWGFLYVHEEQEMQGAARWQGQLPGAGGTRGMAGQEWGAVGTPASAPGSAGLTCREQLPHCWRDP